MFLNICIYAKYKVYILEKFEMKLDILDKQEKNLPSFTSRKKVVLLCNFAKHFKLLET